MPFALGLAVREAAMAKAKPPCESRRSPHPLCIMLLCLVAATGGWKPARAGEPVYANPILPGDWSDPGVIRVGDDYYTCRSSFGWQPGIPIAHSRDLVHWRYIGYAFDSHPKLTPGDTRHGIWGLEMGYNPHARQFLIYAPTRDGEVYVFYADTPEGPYRMSSLGENLGIDPGFFVDDDGRLYLLTNRAVIHELERDGLRIRRDVAKIDKSAYRFFEGPDIFRRGAWYYLLFSDGGTLPHEPSTISVLRAPALEGPWEEDPANPVMFSTDSGARFEGPAHGTLIETQAGEWFVTYHAHEPSHYSLGRQMLMERIEWTDEGWWRPVGGRIPTGGGRAPQVVEASVHLQQTDEFSGADLGLQWFFHCPPDRGGAAWSLAARPGFLRVYPQPGDLGAIEALSAVFLQRVIDKEFSFETCVTFDATSEGEATGLHLYHDPLMNLWLASAFHEGRRVISVGKHNLGERADLWTVENPHGATVHLRVAVDREETATFYFSGDGRQWMQIGQAVYFGASGHHLRSDRRGDPDLGWVARYKDPAATREEIVGRAGPRIPNRGGNIWTATTFGVFAVRGDAPRGPPADFDHLRVTKP